MVRELVRNLFWPFTWMIVGIYFIVRGLLALFEIAGPLDAEELTYWVCFLMAFKCFEWASDHFDALESSPKKPSS